MDRLPIRVYACMFARVCICVCLLSSCCHFDSSRFPALVRFLRAPFAFPPSRVCSSRWPLSRSFPFLFLSALLGCRLPLATFLLALLLSLLLPLHFKVFQTRTPPPGFTCSPAQEARRVHQSLCPVPFPCSPASEARSAHQTRWPLPFVAVLRNGYRVTVLPR